MVTEYKIRSILCYTIKVEQSSIYDVIIVGAGASGLICALECARAGKRVLVLERAPFPGRKILVSGNGRCNFTNLHAVPDCYHADPELIKAAFATFSPKNCLSYFEQLGILYTQEENGRMFPSTGKATAVTDAFKAALAETNAEVLCNTEVIRIKRGKTFLVSTKDASFQSRKLVLACGSCAYPQVSGTQKGYELAQSLGHHIITPRPALSGLCLKENFSRLSGIRFQVRLTAATTPAAQAEGEIIFTAYGINGPAALNISSQVSRALPQGNIPLFINFLPQIENTTDFLQNRLHQFAHRKPKDFFAGLLHESLANLLIDFKGLRKNKPMAEQSPAALTSALNALEKWPATITALRPWNEAMAATGGVNVREINYNTFESNLCPGLYITGELLDVDGKSGGFNLQFAWASGITAAQHIKEQ